MSRNSFRIYLFYVVTVMILTLCLMDSLQILMYWSYYDIIYVITVVHKLDFVLGSIMCSLARLRFVGRNTDGREVRMQVVEMDADQHLYFVVAQFHPESTKYISLQLVPFSSILFKMFIITALNMLYFVQNAMFLSFVHIYFRPLTDHNSTNIYSLNPLVMLSNPTNDIMFSTHSLIIFLV